MKVAIVGIYPESADKIRGGVEAVTLRLSQGLARTSGIEVHVVVCDSSRPVGTSRPESDLHIHSIGGSRRLGNLLLGIPDRRRIAQAIRRIRPDVVHAHSADRFALGAIESGLPAVVTVHGIIEVESGLEPTLSGRMRGRLRNKMAAAALKKAKNVILLSPYVADHYRHRLAHARTWTIENPVNDHFFDLAGSPEPGLILHSGLLIPRKGIRNLLEAVARVKKKVPQVRLRLAGMATVPQYKTAIDETVRRLDLGNSVDFLGGLSPDNVAEELRRSSMLVMVSKQETLPVAIQEAMAAGRPVIASPVGGIPHIVREGESGYLVEYGDPDRLASRMVELLQNDELRARMSSRAREIAEKHFRLAGVCSRTLDVYREIIEG